MRNGLLILSMIGGSLLMLSEPTSADAPLPSPVKTCDDARAYIGADGSMTMETFKSLMRAGEKGLNAQGEAALDQQCKLTAYVKHVVFIQHITHDMTASVEVTQPDGVCKLINVSLNGC